MEEALKMREEVKDDLEEWQRIFDEAEVMLEATRFQELELRRSFHTRCRGLG